jgi:hypothetical protein
MSDKPSYLGLLNAIAVGEAQAHEYLSAWIATTTNPDVKAVLSTVAAREGEHGMAFSKRLDELGYGVRRKDDDGTFAKLMAIAGSSRTDLEKMEKLGLGRLDTGDKPDFFDKVFTDHSIDIKTGELLGRYIAEERDSGRLLASCYRALKAAGEASPTAPAEDRLASLESKVDAVCSAIGELQSMVSSVAGANGDAKRNGRAKPATRAKAKAKTRA